MQQCQVNPPTQGDVVFVNHANNHILRWPPLMIKTSSRANPTSTHLSKLFASITVGHRKYPSETLGACHKYFLPAAKSRRQHHHHNPPPHRRRTASATKNVIYGKRHDSAGAPHDESELQNSCHSSSRLLPHGLQQNLDSEGASVCGGSTRRVLIR